VDCLNTHRSEEKEANDEKDYADYEKRSHAQIVGYTSGATSMPLIRFDTIFSPSTKTMN